MRVNTGIVSGSRRDVSLPKFQHFSDTTTDLSPTSSSHESSGNRQGPLRGPAVFDSVLYLVGPPSHPRWRHLGDPASQKQPPELSIHSSGTTIIPIHRTLIELGHIYIRHDGYRGTYVAAPVVRRRRQIGHWGCWYGNMAYAPQRVYGICHNKSLSTTAIERHVLKRPHSLVFVGLESETARYVTDERKANKAKDLGRPW